MTRILLELWLKTFAIKMPKIIARDFSQHVATQLAACGLHPVLARVFAARQIESGAQLDTALASLLPFSSLQNCEQMACVLADAIRDQEKLLIVADYDADGATACAVGLLGLRAMGAP